MAGTKLGRPHRRRRHHRRRCRRRHRDRGRRLVVSELPPRRGDWRTALLTAAARRAVVTLFTVCVLLAGTSMLFTGCQVRQLRQSVLSACLFAADIAGAPVVAGPAGKPSKLAVSIVSDSRVQWRGLGCPGRLPPPAPSFAKWAKYYHLPAG
jgi:hypothetical protein